MKVAVYAIALNEAGFTERFMDACCEADAVVVADTGSTDRTIDLLRMRGATVHEIAISPWRFDDARNAALALVPRDFDVCVALDLDEVLAPGWRTVLEQGWSPGITRASFTLNYSHLPDGSPGITFLNNRIHARHGYRWRHACHEGLYPDRIEEQVVALPRLVVDHWPDLEKSRSSYLGLLEAAVKEEPGSPRMAHYLAREYYFNGRYEEALAEYERYLAFPGNGFTDERLASMVTMGSCAVALGRDPSPYLLRALAERSDQREPWLGLAEHHYRQGSWAQCYASALQGLAVSEPTPGYPINPHFWGALGHDLAAIAAWNLRLHSEALKHAQLALALSPSDDRLRSNVEFMRTEVKASG